MTRPISLGDYSTSSRSRCPARREDNWSGCYAGGYAGVAWGRGPVDT